MTDATCWAKAFAIQARSDLVAREQLVLGKHLPQCHQLHYLQMAMEKLAKGKKRERKGDITDFPSSACRVRAT